MILPSVATAQYAISFFSKLFKADLIEYGASTDVTIASVFLRAQENFFARSESGNVFFSKDDVQSIDKKNYCDA